MNKEDGRKKQPFNEIDTECLDYIVNELKNNKSMQQMLNYYKGKYYRDRYWELKKQVDKAIDYIENNCLYTQDIDYDYDDNMILSPPTDELERKELLNILKGEEQ